LMLGIYMDTLNICMHIATMLATGSNREKWTDSLCLLHYIRCVTVQQRQMFITQFRQAAFIEV
jgi:hypothetical protein